MASLHSSPTHICSSMLVDEWMRSGTKPLIMDLLGLESLKPYSRYLVSLCLETTSVATVLRPFLSCRLLTTWHHLIVFSQVKFPALFHRQQQDHTFYKPPLSKILTVYLHAYHFYFHVLYNTLHIRSNNAFFPFFWTRMRLMRMVKKKKLHDCFIW